MQNVKDNEIDAIIFDVDGVLIDVSESYRKAIRLTTQKLTGIEITEADVSQVKIIPGFNNDWDAAFALVEQKTKGREIKPLSTEEKSSKEYQKVVDAFQEIYEKEKLIEKDRLLVSLDSIRKLLKLRYKIGVVTGRPKAEAFETFKITGLNEFFDKRNTITLDDVTEDKPNPEGLLKIKVKIGAKNAVYVGDTLNDLLAAKAAKMKAIWVTSGETEYEHPFKVTNVNEFLQKEIETAKKRTSERTKDYIPKKIRR